MFCTSFNYLSFGKHVFASLDLSRMEHYGLFDSSEHDNDNANQDEYDPRGKHDNQPHHSYQHDPRDEHDNQPQHSYQYDPRDNQHQHGEREARADLDNNLHQPELQESNQDDTTHVQETPTNVQETPTNVQEPPSKLVVKDTKPSLHNKPKRLRKRNNRVNHGNHGNQRNKSNIKSNMPKKLGRPQKEPSKVQAAQTTSQALTQQASALNQASPQLPPLSSPLPTLQQAPTKRKADALKPSNRASAKPSAKPSTKPSAKRANTSVDQAKLDLLESRDPATLESRFKGCTIVKDVHVASLVDSGAFGAVFACKTPKGRRIAKVGATTKQLKALVEEFRRYKELSINKTLVPFLLKTYSLVSFNDLLGNPCRAITMDYGGIDLFAMMKQKGMTALNLRDTKSLCRRVLPALKAFHLAGYVHRDVKPQNILILPAEGSGFSSMSIKLIDFGLVTKWDPKAKVVAKRSLTCGTARFSSWRQQLGYTAHPHDDLESLIYTMIFLLGGKLPWSSAWSDEPAKHLERDANMSAIKQKADCQMLCLKLDTQRRDTTEHNNATTHSTTTTSNFARILQTVRDSTTFDVRNYTTLMELCA